jgi:pimeloyl-ACP methyl ester carboxylesterase
MRSGQLSALGSDLIEMVQALGLGRFAIVGHDGGARAAYIVATEYSEHISHLVAISVESPNVHSALHKSVKR